MCYKCIINQVKKSLSSSHLINENSPETVLYPLRCCSRPQQQSGLAFAGVKTVDVVHIMGSEGFLGSLNLQGKIKLRARWWDLPLPHQQTCSRQPSVTWNWEFSPLPFQNQKGHFNQSVMSTSIWWTSHECGGITRPRNTWSHWTFSFGLFCLTLFLWTKLDQKIFKIFKSIWVCAVSKICLKFSPTLVKITGLEQKLKIKPT